MSQVALMLTKTLQCLTNMVTVAVTVAVIFKRYHTHIEYGSDLENTTFFFALQNAALARKCNHA